MSELEQQMLKVLGKKMTPYVGKNLQEIKIDEGKLQLDRHRAKRRLRKKQKMLLQTKHEKLKIVRATLYPAGKYSFRRILEITCAVHGVTEEEVLGPRRFLPLVRARQTIVRIMHEKRGVSWVLLGRMLNRDHSTVINSYHKALQNSKDANYVEIARRVEEYQNRTGQLERGDSPDP